MATSGQNQIVGYKYRTPLRAQTLSYIIGHLATVGLTTRPTFQVSDNAVTISPFSCYLHYTDTSESFDKQEQLVKYVSQKPVTRTITDPATVAIGVKFSFAPPSSSPTMDWYPDIEFLRMHSSGNTPGVEDYPGIIIGVCHRVAVSGGNVWVVSSNGADFSNQLIEELGWDPTCWLTVKSPRSLDDDFYKKLEFRNSTSETHLANEVLELDLLDTIPTNGDNPFVLKQISNPEVTDMISSSGTPVIPTNPVSASRWVFALSNGSLVTVALAASATTGELGTLAYNLGLTGKILGYIELPTTNAATKLTDQREAILLGLGPSPGVSDYVLETIYQSYPCHNDLSRILLEGGKGQILQTQPVNPSVDSNNLVLRWITARGTSIYRHFRPADDALPNDKATPVSAEGLYQSFEDYTHKSGTALNTDLDNEKLVSVKALQDTLPSINNAHNYSSQTSIFAPVAAEGGTGKVLVPGATANAAPVWSAEPTVTSVTTTSSLKKKKNIREYRKCATDLLQAIRIVSFEYKDQENDEDHIGFIAEDTDSLLAGKKHDKMKHAECIALLIKAVQELDDRITRLENESKPLRFGNHPVR